MKTACLTTLALALMLAMSAIVPVGAEEAPGTSGARALGFTVDLLPIVMSATTGEAGFSLQAWAGADHFRIRAVGARVSLPDALIGEKNFTDHDMLVGAVIADYIFGERFAGFWAGAGGEYWHNTIRHENPGGNASWDNAVLTVGGGYIWKVYGNLFVEPWTAAHLVLNGGTVKVAGASYTPQRLSAEVSLKIGYFFDM